MKITLEAIEIELMRLIATENVTRDRAKYLVWSSLSEENPDWEFIGQTKEFMLEYVSPHRVLH